MATSTSNERDIQKIDGTQLFDNAFLQTSDVLRELGKLFRTACGIEPLDPKARITEGEAHMIFTFCYVCHNGSSASWETRVPRSLRDIYEYVDPGGRGHVLPYYVMRTYHRYHESGSLDTVFTPQMIEIYKSVISIMDQPIPDYAPLASHTLPRD